MPRTQGERSSGHGKILFRPVGNSRGGRRLLQFLDFGRGGLLQFVEFPSEFSLEIRTASPELFEQLGDLTFLSQEPYPGFLHVLRVSGLQLSHLREQLFNRFFHYVSLNITAI